MLLLGLLLLTVLRGFLAVRFQYLGVPGSVLRGDSVWLDCGYDLEEDELYSVKWYKDNYEFYRFLPSDYPQSQILNLKGVYVDLNLSNSSHVYLKLTDLDTEGTFACEVSTDAPSFRTVRAEKKLRVYVMPDGEPRILGIQNKYSSGDTINASCVYGPSKPIAKLNWLINEDRAPNFYVTNFIKSNGDNEVGTAESRLRFVVDPSHLWHGVLTIKCTADISQVYAESSEEIIIGDGITGTEFQRLTQTAPGQQGPHVAGVDSLYEVGDHVDLNCTSARSASKADLMWSINDEEVKREFLQFYPALKYPDGSTSSRLGLKFRVHDDHFVQEELRIKCTSTLSKDIKLTSAKTIFGGSHRSMELMHLSGSSPSDNVHLRLNIYGCSSVAGLTLLIYIISLCPR